MRKQLALLCAASLFVVSCGRDESESEPESREIASAATTVEVVPTRSDIVRVVVTVTRGTTSQPFELKFDAATGKFTGQILLVPAPQQRFSVVASIRNPARETDPAALPEFLEVARGETVQDVVEGTATRIVVNIVDDTIGGVPDPTPLGPIVTGISQPAVVRIGEIVSFTATAVDPDGLATGLTYAWSQVCANGRFGPADPPPDYVPATATVPWSNAVVERCTITVTVTDPQGLADSKSFVVDVLPPAGWGAVDMEGVFIEQPLVNSLSFRPEGQTACTVQRSSPNGSCPTDYTSGRTATVQVSYSGALLVPDVILSAECGAADGTITRTIANASFARFTWAEPTVTASTVCILTATVAAGPATNRRSDAMTIAVLLNP